MKPIVVSDVLAVGEVPSPDQMEILAKAGFKSVVNTQPDGEVERFPGSAKLAAEAKRCGLAYAYAPLASRMPGDAELAAFAKALKSLPAPIFGFCYSGARTAAGCALLLTETMEPNAIIAQFEAAGFDLGGLKPWLEDERKRRAPATPTSAKATPANGAAASPQKPVQAPAPAVLMPPPVVPATTATPAPKALEGIVVHARAMGYGGFAM
ncbi:MAG: beta-lactamase hydrolase domain-containing protein [Hyphomicrobiaceae bacterium]